MKIIIIHPRMDVLGGGERVAVHSIITALKTGHEVILISEEFNIPAFEDFFACQGLFERVQTLSYPSFRPMVHRAVLYQRLLYHQRRVRRLIPKAGKYDLVLSTQDVAYLPPVSGPNVQYCYFPEYFVHLESSRYSRLWKEYYLPAKVFYRKRISHIDCLLSTSNFTAAFVRERWRRDSTTLYPPCPIDLYNNLNGQKQDLVVTVGRVVPEKRMDLFLEMARRLPQVRFALIGSIAPELVSYFQRLRDTAPANVSFVMSPLRKAAHLLAGAKVYVHSARNEHFGITVVEAMAAGCVPVVHDSGGPREIVIPEVGFRWASPDDATRQITTLIQNDGLRQKLSNAARERSKMFSAEKFEKGLQEVLTSVEKPDLGNRPT